MMSQYFFVVHCELALLNYPYYQLINGQTKTNLELDADESKGAKESFLSLRYYTNPRSSFKKSLFLTKLAEHLTKVCQNPPIYFATTEKEALKLAHHNLLKTPGLMLSLAIDESDSIPIDDRITVSSKVVVRRENILSFKKIIEAPYNLTPLYWIKKNFSYQHCTVEYKDLFLIVGCIPSRSLFYTAHLEMHFNKIIESTNELCPEDVDPTNFIDCLAAHLTQVSSETEITIGLSEEKAWEIENRHSHRVFCFVVQTIVPSTWILPELAERDLFKTLLNANQTPYPRLKKGFVFSPSDIISIKAMPRSSYHNSTRFNYENGTIADRFNISPPEMITEEYHVPVFHTVNNDQSPEISLREL